MVAVLLKHFGSNNRYHLYMRRPDWQDEEADSSIIKFCNAGLNSELQNFSYSALSPPFFLTSTTTKEGVNSKISAAMVKGPFTPSLQPSKLTLQSFFLTVKLTN
ncbi:hypothetical protein CR513_57801, partial [Mucuna pruriens]